MFLLYMPLKDMHVKNPRKKILKKKPGRTDKNDKSTNNSCSMLSAAYLTLYNTHLIFFNIAQCSGLHEMHLKNPRKKILKKNREELIRMTEVRTIPFQCYLQLV